MTFKDLARTFEIFAKYEDGEVICDWAEHDEYGYSIDFQLTIDEIKELRNMGWMLGCDSELSEDDAEMWDADNTETTDEQLLELWDCYKGIFTFA